MGITSLPIEIKLMILRHCEPDDFESFALSCQAHYNAAQPLIKHHNTYRKKYRSVTFPHQHGQSQDPNAIQSVPELLAQIAVDPKIANYIVHLDLHGRHFLCYTEPAVARFEASEDALREILASSAYLKAIDGSSEYIEQWLVRLRTERGGYHEEVDFATAFLLTLLPNLESLRLSKEWKANTVDFIAERGFNDQLENGFDRSIRDLVQLIIRRANDESLQGQPLSKLNTLLPTLDADTRMGFDMLCIVPFLALNSMRHVLFDLGYLLACCTETSPPLMNWDGGSDYDEDADEVYEDSIEDDCETYDEYGDLDGSDESEVGEEDNMIHSSQENTDQDSQTNSEGRILGSPDSYNNHFLSHRYPILGNNIKSLTLSDCFMGPDACVVLLRNMHNLKTFHFNYSRNPTSVDIWDIENFFQSLMHTVGPHLENLIMSASSVNNESEVITQPLHGFKALKHIELSTVFFVSGAGSVGVNWPCSNGNWRDPVPPLVEILPESLETLTLSVPCVDYACLTELCRFWGVSKRLYNLKSVKLNVPRMDCWGNEFPHAERKVKIVKLLAEEYGFECN